MPKIETSCEPIALNVSSTRFRLSVFFALVTLKIILLFYIGPLLAADTDDYYRFANSIITENSWRLDARLEDGEILVDRWRIIGYPALIAGALFFFGADWIWALALFQVIASAAAITYFSDFLRVASRSIIVTMFGTFSVATSVSFIWDNFLITDSLHASLLIGLFTALAASRLQSKHPPSIKQAIIFGLFLALAFLLRDMTVYLAAFTLPIVLLWSWPTSGNAVRSFCVVIAFYLPLASVVAIYFSWNNERSGQTFLTTSMRTAGLVPLFRMAAHGEHVFDRNASLDEAARLALEEVGSEKILATTYGVMQHVYVANRVLTEEFEMDAVAISQAVSNRLINVIFTKPMVILRYLKSQLRPGALLRLFFQPVYSMTAIHEIRAKRSDVGALTRFAPLLNAISSGKHIVAHSALLVAEGFSRIIAITLGIGYLVLFPASYFLGFARGHQTEKSVWLALWFIPFATSLLYGIVHFEPRYLMSTIPFAVLVAIIAIRDVWTRYLRQGALLR